MAGIASLEAAGRGKDTHLMHVTTKELQGLHALAAAHGQKMTKNPKTGLYEAGWLEKLVPMAATAAASYFGGPWAGAMVGGAMGAMGNPKNPLMGAGLGALGGYGMGGLSEAFVGAGLGEAAVPLAESMVGNAAYVGADGVALSAPGMTNFSNLQSLGGTGGIPEMGGKSLFDISKSALANSGVPLPGEALANSFLPADYSTVGGAGSSLANPSVQELARAPVEAFQDPNAYTNIAANPMYMGPTTTAEQYSGNLFKGPGSQAVGQKVLAANLSPSEKWDAFVKGIPKTDILGNKDIRRNAMMAGVGALGAASLSQNTGKPLPGTSPYVSSYKPQVYHPPVYNPQTGLYESPPAFTPYAQGGIAGLAGGGAPTQPRMVKGPGTGLSDDIPAEIQGGQKAALADGEFVVSSDVVSALGGGSTDAGARKLYAMMDRIRKQAHGTKKQVKKVPDRAMAA